VYFTYYVSRCPSKYFTYFSGNASSLACFLLTADCRLLLHYLLVWLVYQSQSLLSLISLLPLYSAGNVEAYPIWRETDLATQDRRYPQESLRGARLPHQRPSRGRQWQAEMRVRCSHFDSMYIVVGDDLEDDC
jgi:hypothetical protein